MDSDNRHSLDSGEVVSREDADEMGVNSYLGTLPLKVYMELSEVTDDEEVAAKLPRTADMLTRLAEALNEVLGEVNWAMDPENPDQSGAAADRRAVKALKEALSQAGEQDEEEDIEVVE